MPSHPRHACAGGGNGVGQGSVFGREYGLHGVPDLVVGASGFAP